MKFPLKILLLENNSVDAEIIQNMLLKENKHSAVKLVADKESFLQALEAFSPDIVLSGNATDQLNASEALTLTRGHYQDTAFILIADDISEASAACIMRQGADDYILKDRLVRLPSAISAAIRRRQSEQETGMVLKQVIKSEEKYSILIQRMTDAFITLDKEWNYTYLNNRACELLKADAGMLIGKSVWSVFPEVVGSATYKAFHAAMQSQQYVCNVDYYQPLDLWQENHIYPSPEGLSVFIRDITAKRKAEEAVEQSVVEKQALVQRTSAILNTLPANIALLNEWGFIVDVNDAWRNFADTNGFVGSNYGVGDNYLNISEKSFGTDEQDGKFVAAGIQSLLENSTNEFVFEYACHSPHVKRWFRMVATSLQHKNLAGAVVMHVDISELRKLEEETLTSKIEEQKKITEAILCTQENERRAIGEELHDNINQLLVGTKVLISTLKDNPPYASNVIDTCMEIIQEAIEENRKISHILTGPDFEEKTLIEQLLKLADNMFTPSGINVFITTAQLNEALLSNQHKLAVFRIAQEQCTNIVKYAGASMVNIQLSSNESICRMMIEDDGNGMETGKKINGIGLKNIKGRLSVLNGSATIQTSKGSGFRLEIVIPI